MDTTETKVRCRHDELLATDVLLTKRNPKNPNKHSAKQIKRLAEIMAYQGIRHPIVISKLSGLISKGHGRLEAAMYNGWTQFPVEYQDYENKDQELADLVSDNAIAMQGELDLAMVNALVPEIHLDSIDLLGIENFTVDVAEKLPENALEPEKCASCGQRIKAKVT
jgi:hypothetical protein